MTTTLFVMLNTMSAQAGITERTWLVTCLGFTIVLVLLLLFVFVMKGLGWLMQPRQKAVVAEPAKQETAATATATQILLLILTEFRLTKAAQQVFTAE